MDDKQIWFLISLGINVIGCIYHCYGIIRNNKRWENQYLKGFDDGCKWIVDEVKNLK